MKEHKPNNQQHEDNNSVYESTDEENEKRRILEQIEGWEQRFQELDDQLSTFLEEHGIDPSKPPDSLKDKGDEP